MPIELHTPTKPLQNPREFVVHIAPVTIGILIALALEGLVQAIQHHRLVSETRQEFQAELHSDQKRAHIELAGVRDANRKLKQLVADLPVLMKSHPEQIVPRLYSIQNPGYFFPANSWQTALSTGALAHMPPEEVEQYADVFYVIRSYADAQRDGLATEDRAKAFAQSHLTSNAADLEEGVERIVLFARAENGREDVCERMDTDINGVLPGK